VSPANPRHPQRPPTGFSDPGDKPTHHPPSRRDAREELGVERSDTPRIQQKTQLDPGRGSQTHEESRSREGTVVPL